MIINGINVDDKLIENYEVVAQKVGNKLSKYVAGNPILNEAFPRWVSIGNAEIFNVETLKRENDGLATSIVDEEPWMLGKKSLEVQPGEVDPTKIVLFAFDLGADSFLALHFGEGSPRIICMIDGQEGVMWSYCKLAFADFLSQLVEDTSQT